MKTIKDKYAFLFIWPPFLIDFIILSFSLTVNCLLGDRLFNCGAELVVPDVVNLLPDLFLSIIRGQKRDKLFILRS